MSNSDTNAELARLRAACQKNDNDIEQILGRALGYPRYCDDQINFPGSTEADGVCVGDHVAASLAMQASDLVAQLRAELDAAPTATLRQQLAGSQSALSKVMGELTERTDELAKARGALFSAKNTIKEERNNTASERGARSEALAEVRRLRAALAKAERERDEARAATDNARASGHEAAKSALAHYAMEKRNARTYERLAASYAAIASRQRRTIRALVVSARAMGGTAMAWRAGSFTTHDVLNDWRQRIKAERGQAGKE